MLNIKKLREEDVYLLGEEESIKFEGTISELCDLVKKNYIKPIIKDNTIVGLNYSNKKHNSELEDVQNQYSFFQAYSTKPIYHWYESILEAKELLDKDKYLILEIIKNLLEDSKESSEIDNQEEPSPLPSYEFEGVYTIEASKLGFNKEYMKNLNSSKMLKLQKAVKKYLRHQYSRYLQRSCVLKIEVIFRKNKYYLEVSEVRWGRYISKSEKK